MFLQETYSIEDTVYYDTKTYTSDTSLDISLPSTFKLEFDLYPKSRSTSSGGVSHYLKLSRTSSQSDIWVGQGTSGGSHGIMVRPSTNNWVSSNTVLNTENHVVVTYNGSVVSYTCNNESKTVSNTVAFNKLYGVSSTTNGNVKNIKLKPL